MPGGNLNSGEVAMTPAHKRP